MQVLAKLEELNKRYEELNAELARPEVVSDPNKLKKVAKEQSELDEIVKTYRAFTEVDGEISELEQLVREEEDPELAEEIKKRMFVFEDIVLLDDRAIQKVLREVDTAELAKALRGVEGEVQDKIFKNMSKRAAALLKEEMEYMGPIRLKDVEETQQKIVSIIRKLEDSGEIVVARSGEDEMVI